MAFLHTSSYTFGTKTAISIPDSVFEEAEKIAEKEGLSRSELYTTALREFLKRKRSEELAENYNAVFAQEDSSLDPIPVV